MYLKKVISRKTFSFLLVNDKNSRIRIRTKMSWIRNTGVLARSVADPEPNPDRDPPDPHVFGPPESGSGSISQRYGSGSSSGSGSDSDPVPYPSIIKLK